MIDKATRPQRDAERAYERAMRERGYANTSNALANAIAHGYASSLAPWRQVAAHYTTKVLARINQLLIADSLRYDARSIIDVGVKPAQLATITVRRVVDLLAGNRAMAWSGLEFSVGSALDRERRICILNDREPGLCRDIEARASSRTFRKKLLDDLCNERGIGPWTPSERRKLGSGMMELVRAAGMLQTRFEGGRQYARIQSKVTTWALRYSEDLCQDALDLRPMLVPPRPWNSVDDGGYYDREVAKHIRGVIRCREAEWFDDASRFRAPNILQETAWAVEPRVLAAALHVFHVELEVGDIPKTDEPSFPRFEDCPDQRTFHAQLQRLKRASRARVNRRMLAGRILTAMRELSGAPFFFVWRYDFRGRMYPVAQRLSFHGPELTRGILTFAKPYRVDAPDARAWLQIYGADLAGRDRESIDSRLAWFHAHREIAIDAARDPFGPAFAFWSGASKPWRMLAWCYALDDLATKGETTLPVVFDATSNAYQILAGILNSQTLAVASNLVRPPKDNTEPRDIYTQVATFADGFPDLTDEVRADIRTLLGGITRKAAKAVVMPFPMGATRSGAAREIRVMVDAAMAQHPVPALSQARVKAAERAVVLALRWAAEASLLHVEDWRRWCKEVGTWLKKSEKWVGWEAPDGFPIVHRYRKGSMERIDTHSLGPKRPGFLVNTAPDELDTHSIAQAFAASIISSMDATVARGFVKRCAHAGAENLVVIHDCYGGRACDAVLHHRQVRETMIEIFRTGPLHSIKKAVLKKLKQMPDLKIGPNLVDPDAIRASVYLCS